MQPGTHVNNPPTRVVHVRNVIDTALPSDIATALSQFGSISYVERRKMRYGVVINPICRYLMMLPKSHQCLVEFSVRISTPSHGNPLTARLLDSHSQTIAEAQRCLDACAVNTFIHAFKHTNHPHQAAPMRLHGRPIYMSFSKSPTITRSPYTSTICLHSFLVHSRAHFLPLYRPRRSGRRLA